MAAASASDRHLSCASCPSAGLLSGPGCFGSMSCFTGRSQTPAVLFKVLQLRCQWWSERVVKSTPFELRPVSTLPVTTALVRQSSSCLLRLECLQEFLPVASPMKLKWTKAHNICTYVPTSKHTRPLGRSGQQEARAQQTLGDGNTLVKRLQRRHSTESKR